VRKISRAAAKSAGKKRYFTGKPCAQGNVSVISHRANRIKTDASLAELRKVCDWLAKNVK
jgi:hypothetical protein